MRTHIVLVTESDFQQIVKGDLTDIVYSFSSEVLPKDNVRIRQYFTQPSDILAPEIEAIVVKVRKVATKIKGIYNYQLGLNVQLIMF
jgi:hypothetical protein